MSVQSRNALIWAIFLIAAGIVFLLQNIGFLGSYRIPWVAVLMAAIGLAFLVGYFTSGREWGLLVPTFIFFGIAFLIWNGTAALLGGAAAAGIFLLFFSMPFLLAFVQGGRSQWWGLIPAGIFICIGLALLLVQFLGVLYLPAIILWGFGLAFLSVFLVNRENWWGLLPCGIFISVGMIFPLIAAGVGSGGWIGAVISGGLALTFLAVYLLARNGWMGWALWTAAFFVLLAIAFVVFTLLGGLWWPLFLIGSGIFVLFYTMQRSHPRPVS